MRIIHQILFTFISSDYQTKKRYNYVKHDNCVSFFVTQKLPKKEILSNNRFYRFNCSHTDFSVETDLFRSSLTACNSLSFRFFPPNIRILIKTKSKNKFVNISNFFNVSNNLLTLMLVVVFFFFLASKKLLHKTSDWSKTWIESFWPWTELTQFSRDIKEKVFCVLLC